MVNLFFKMSAISSFEYGAKCNSIGLSSILTHSLGKFLLVKSMALAIPIRINFEFFNDGHSNNLYNTD